MEIVPYIVLLRRKFKKRIEDPEFKEISRYGLSDTVKREVMIAFERACLDAILDEELPEEDPVEMQPYRVDPREVENYITEMNKRNAERLKDENTEG